MYAEAVAGPRLLCVLSLITRSVVKSLLQLFYSASNNCYSGTPLSLPPHK